MNNCEALFRDEIKKEYRQFFETDTESDEAINSALERWTGIFKMLEPSMNEYLPHEIRSFVFQKIQTYCNQLNLSPWEGWQDFSMIMEHLENELAARVSKGLDMMNTFIVNGRNFGNKTSPEIAETVRKLMDDPSVKSKKNDSEKARAIIKRMEAQGLDKIPTFHTMRRLVKKITDE